MVPGKLVLPGAAAKAVKISPPARLIPGYHSGRREEFLHRGGLRPVKAVVCTDLNTPHPVTSFPLPKRNTLAVDEDLP